MQTTNGHESVADRPVRSLARRDLRLQPVRFRRTMFWTIQDPASLRCYQLREEERFILELLDGTKSLAEIKRQFERAYAPRKLDVPHLQAFLSVLYREGLIVSQAPGQGEHLLARRNEISRHSVLSTCSNLLAIRLRGINPEPLLGWLLPKCRWMLSPWFLGGALLLVLSAVLLLVTQYETLQSRLPEFRSFFHVRSVVWFALAIGLSKVLHELGHALTCKHFGGKCHEMGIMFLVFTPCLYCNVSDAWLLPSKWHRIAISAAGIAVELVLASICTFAWWFSEPGYLNSLCLSMLLVCSVNTLLINGNPLLRFDGYYMLADLIEIPNLRQQSSRQLRRLMGRWFLGKNLDHDLTPDGEPSGLLLAYGVASLLYRCVVLAGILWFCYAVLERRGLAVIAQLLAVAVVLAAVIPPGARGIQLLRDPGKSHGLRLRRLIVAACVLFGAISAVLWIPFSRRVSAPVYLQSTGTQRVYVTVPGVLMESVTAGEVVSRDQPLARLRNLDLELTISKLQAQRDLQKLHVENLQRLQGDQPHAAEQLPTAEAALRDVQEQLAQRLLDQRKLVLRAAQAGTVLPPPAKPAQSTPDGLGFWNGTPIDENNLNSCLDVGTLFCLVGDPQRQEACAVIEQGQVNWIQPGQKVRLQFDQLASRIVTGRVVRLSEMDVSLVPRELVSTAGLPVGEGDDGMLHLLSTCYEARIALDQQNLPLRLGASGQARIEVEAESLGTRLYRYLRRTFSLTL